MMTPKKKLEKLPLALPNKNQFEKLPLTLPNKNQFEKLPLTPEAAGSYMANLVPTKAPVTSAPVVTEPKVMASEATGGEGGEGSGKIELEYPTYQSYQDYVNGRESSILEAYDAAKKYAKDNYNIAAREAAGNFRANQPTYGANAERLLSSGLTGGGYSDYITGKAYEARANEINAARSQMNYANMLAHQEYNEAKDNLNELKFSYTTQLNEAYKAKLDEAIQKIKEGYYDADVAAKLLRNYTTDGQLSDDALAILKSTEDNYWKANNSSMKSAFLDYINSSLAAGIPLTEASMRQWLIDNVKGITEDEIAAYMDGYFKDGKLDKNAVAGAVNNKPQTGTTDNDTLLSQLASALGISVDDIKNKLGIQTSVGGTGTGGSTVGGTGSGGGTGGSGGTGETKTEPYTFEQTIDTFKKFVSDHKAKNADDYKAMLEQLVNDSLVDGSKAWNQEAAEKIRNMASGLVVSSGTFDRNNGFQRSFQEGDNFHVTIGGETYRVDSQGYASDEDEVVKAAKDIADGAMFGYGSELYLKVGDDVVKIGPRPGIGNRDYDKLWRAVYGEQLSNIKAGVNEIKNEGKQTSNEKENTEEREPLLYQAYMGVKNAIDDADQSIQNGVDKLFFNNSRNEAEDQTTDSGETNATEEEKGLFGKIGDFFRNIRLGSKAFGDKTSLAPPTNNIRDAIASVWPREENADAEPKEITRGVAHYERDGMFDRGLVKGDNFTVEVNGKSYKVESGGEVTDQVVIDAANESGIYNGEVFQYGDELYLKRNDKIYSVEQRFFAPNQDELLRFAIEGNADAVPGEDADNLQSGVFLDSYKKLDAMKKIELEDLDGNEYKLQIRAVLGSDSAAYKAANNVSDGEAFIFGKDIYLKNGDEVYKLGAAPGGKNGDYDRVAEQLRADNDPSTESYKTQGVVAIKKGRVGNAIGQHENYTVDRHGNLEPKENVKVSIGKESYWVKSGEKTTSGAYRVAKSEGAQPGEIYAWNGELYMFLGDASVRLEEADLGADAAYLGYDDLKYYLEKGKTKEEDGIITSYSRYLKETT